MNIGGYFVRKEKGGWTAAPCFVQVGCESGPFDDPLPTTVPDPLWHFPPPISD